MRKFVAYKRNIAGFIVKVLYISLSYINEARELKKDFRRHINIELDPRSFKFSTIISGRTPILEGFDEDPEESFF